MTEISPEILHTHTHQKKRRKKESTVDSYISIIYHGNCKAMNGSDCNWKKTNGTKPVSARMERGKKKKEAFLHVATLLKQSDRFSVDLVGLQLW